MAERLVGAMSWSAVCGGEILRFVRYEKEVDIPVNETFRVEDSRCTCGIRAISTLVGLIRG
jgi:hypothetical protein